MLRALLKLSRGNRLIVLSLLALTALALAAIALARPISQATAEAQSRSPLSQGLPSGSGAYIRFEGIEGGSQDRGYEGWSDLASFSHSITAPLPGGDGPIGGIGRVVFRDIYAEKSVDKATPKLYEAAASSRVIPMVEIRLTQPTNDGSRAVYYTYALRNVLVTSYNVGGLYFGEVPSEQISLSFEQITVTYSEFGPDGSAVADHTFTWDVNRAR